MSTRELTQVAKELIAAKKRIENEADWSQWNYVEENGARCAIAAFREAFSKDLAVYYAALERLGDACLQLYGDGCIVSINEDGHTYIIHAFDHAIATEIQKANAS